MTSRPQTFVLLIGAARAVPYSTLSNPTHDIPERNVEDSAANGDAADYVRLEILPSSSAADTANLQNLVTPVTPSFTVDPAHLVTPIGPSSNSILYELTEITPVPQSTSITRPTTTISSASPTPTTEAQTPPLPTSSSVTTPAIGEHNTIIITDWVTVTLPGPPPNDPNDTTALPEGCPQPTEAQTAGSVTFPLTAGQVHHGSSTSRRPEVPGGILGGPSPNTDELGESQPRE